LVPKPLIGGRATGGGTVALEDIGGRGVALGDRGREVQGVIVFAIDGIEIDIAPQDPFEGRLGGQPRGTC
jgi:hypothetical protein